VTFLLIAAIGQTIFKLLLTLMAIFLILLVLVQRGRGGGLAGALGGMGGSSAFGAKAGDVFTRVTIVAATLWILLCIAAAKMAPSSSESRINTGLTAPAADSSAESLAEEEAAGGETASEESAPADQAAPVGEPADSGGAGPDDEAK
jgi:preprotein translocase subunit SecG